MSFSDYGLKCSTKFSDGPLSSFVEQLNIDPTMIEPRSQMAPPANSRDNYPVQPLMRLPTGPPPLPDMNRSGMTH